MNPIPEVTVHKTWEEMINIPPEKAPELIEQMKEEQPLLLAYLMAAEDELFDQDSREFLLFFGIVIWQIMLQGDTPLPELTEEMIEEQEEFNFQLLDEHEDELETDFATLAESLLEGYNQEEILRQVTESIIDELEEEGDLTSENQELMYIYLKTVIDCLDQ